MVEELLRVLWIAYLGYGEVSWKSFIEGLLLNRVAVVCCYFICHSKNRYIQKRSPISSEISTVVAILTWVPQNNHRC